MSASEALAAFAHGLRFEDIPSDVVERAKICIIDTAAVTIFGASFPWSRTLAEYARRYGSGGTCSLLGSPGAKVHAPYAALANGAAAHAFEQDSLRSPGAGVHPGACLLPPALAIAEERKSSGRELLVAFVAGCEVLFRIGKASRHSSEALGFHAPGLTGPFGAAIAAGILMRLNEKQLAAALGIAGSLSCGLLAFAAARRGSSVKKLHLGRAAEAGVLAASLAAGEFDGPETVLEGKHGFLQAYCRNPDVSRLTDDLGRIWESRRICIKRYPCHITAHTSVQGLRDLMGEAHFGAADVDEIAIEVADKVLSQHNIASPADIKQGQYSVPFCVALALHRDPLDPRSFDEGAVADESIRATCRRVRLIPFDGKAESSWHTRLTVFLKNGRKLTRDCKTFKGMPEEPLDMQGIREKYLGLTTGGERGLLAHLERLEFENLAFPV